MKKYSSPRLEICSSETEEYCNDLDNYLSAIENWDYDPEGAGDD